MIGDRYKDISGCIAYEPIVKKQGLLLRLFYDGRLIATIDHTGDIQRQVLKEYKVFWDMGVLIVFQYVEDQ